MSASGLLPTLTVKKVLVVAAALSFTVAGMWALQPPLSEEDRVRATIEQVVEGAREADVNQVMAPIAEGYRDEEGEGHSRQDLAALLYVQFTRRGPLSVVTSPMEVTVRADRATASFEAAIADFDEGAGLVEGLLPADADVWVVEVDLEKQGREWKILTYRRD